MLGLLYDGNRSLNLVGFAYVHEVEDFDSRISTSSHCFTFVGGLIVELLQLLMM